MALDFLNFFRFNDSSKKSLNVANSPQQGSLFRFGGQNNATSSRSTTNQIDNSTSSQTFLILNSPDASISAPTSKKFGSTTDLATPTSFTNPFQVSPSVFGSSQGSGSGTSISTALIVVALVGGAIIIVPSVLKGGKK